MDLHSLVGRVTLTFDFRFTLVTFWARPVTLTLKSTRRWSCMINVLSRRIPWPPTTSCLFCYENSSCVPRSTVCLSSKVGNALKRKIKLKIWSGFQTIKKKIKLVQWWRGYTVSDKRNSNGSVNKVLIDYTIDVRALNLQMVLNKQRKTVNL